MKTSTSSTFIFLSVIQILSSLLILLPIIDAFQTEMDLGTGFLHPEEGAATPADVYAGFNFKSFSGTYRNHPSDLMEDHALACDYTKVGYLSPSYKAATIGIPNALFTRYGFQDLKNYLSSEGKQHSFYAPSCGQCYKISYQGRSVVAVAADHQYISDVNFDLSNSLHATLKGVETTGLYTFSVADPGNFEVGELDIVPVDCVWPEHPNIHYIRESNSDTDMYIHVAFASRPLKELNILNGKIKGKVVPVMKAYNDNGARWRFSFADFGGCLTYDTNHCLTFQAVPLYGEPIEEFVCFKNGGNPVLPQADHRTIDHVAVGTKNFI